MLCGSLLFIFTICGLTHLPDWISAQSSETRGSRAGAVANQDEALDSKGS